MKDNEKDIVVFLAASAAAEAEDEALQLGALAALHRVAGDRAMHRVLPHAYTPAWERFSQEVCTLAVDLMGSWWPKPASRLKKTSV